MKHLLKSIAVTAAMVIPLAACQDDATIATENLKKAADNFEVNRRVVFYNGITDSYILTVEGRCSMDLNAEATAFNVICKVGPSEYKRHTLVLADNVSAFVEQLEPVTASAYHYRVTFKPQSIFPDIDFRGDAGELTTNSSEANQ
jgi:zona occludens toxin (predicted ATPase)